MTLTLPGNPYALFVDNKVTFVVNMDTYDKDAIAEILTRFEYDFAVPCSDFDRVLFTGEEFLAPDHIKTLGFYKNWIYNVEQRKWEPPYPKPKLTEEEWDEKTFYSWDDERIEWALTPFSEEELNTLTVEQRKSIALDLPKTFTSSDGISQVYTGSCCSTKEPINAN
jgi:hypothetical protein